MTEGNKALLIQPNGNALGKECTRCFTLKGYINHNVYRMFCPISIMLLIVPQGRYFINRRLQPADKGYSPPTSPARAALCNKVSSLRDLEKMSGIAIRRLKPTVNKILSLRDKAEGF